ncbi:hypothetical protein OTU49_000512 [Cherax quadricarinatus]|uniref:INPP5B PH domain-containing protein n=1 Tax=Cherax quadricarinatus TaxID=27406 RepID=A0AAW0XZ93_CHEQU
MELSPHVQEKLLSGHKLTAVVEAGLVQEFIKTTRVVALIEVTTQEIKQGGEQALLIFQTARVPVHSAIDLSIEQVLPIDSNLKCELDEYKVLDCSMSRTVSCAPTGIQVG